ncbi:hypothetical protein F5Y16DRAFT_404661 [Xylariaceae sp. FL0255]|nr:hypothetical protein F5Y16DRAFT_404661 [Xylariaceae sp. FL0255]
MDQPELAQLACSRALRLPEILILIAQQIVDHAPLYNACLVNHAFNAAFTRQLYKRLVWSHRNYDVLFDDEKRRRLLEHREIAYTKTFVITRHAVSSLMRKWAEDYVLERSASDIDVWVRATDHYARNGSDMVAEDMRAEDPFMYGLLCIPGFEESVKDQVYMVMNRVIMEICQKTVRLQTFFCKEVLISSECASVLCHLPMLEVVFIHLPPDLRRFFDITWRAPGSRRPVYLDRRARYGHLNSSFEFANLKQLAVLCKYIVTRQILRRQRTNMGCFLRAAIPYGLNTWRKNVLQVVMRSPRLERLALSLDVRYSNLLRAEGDMSFAFPEGDDEYADNGEEQDDIRLETWIEDEYQRNTGQKLTVMYTTQPLCWI